MELPCRVWPRPFCIQLSDTAWHRDCLDWSKTGVSDHRLSGLNGNFVNWIQPHRQLKPPCEKKTREKQQQQNLSPQWRDICNTGVVSLLLSDFAVNWFGKKSMIIRSVPAVAAAWSVNACSGVVADLIYKKNKKKRKKIYIYFILFFKSADSL